MIIYVKAYKFYDTAVLKKEISLIPEKGKKGMILLFQMTILFDEIIWINIFIFYFKILKLSFLIDMRLK